MLGRVNMLKGVENGHKKGLFEKSICSIYREVRFFAKLCEFLIKIGQHVSMLFGVASIAFIALITVDPSTSKIFNILAITCSALSILLTVLNSSADIKKAFIVTRQIEHEYALLKVGFLSGNILDEAAYKELKRLSRLVKKLDDYEIIQTGILSNKEENDNDNDSDGK